jgi:MinD superfamily P-loop ATPase
MIISVASGKGGTGKTLVATSLAGSLQDKYEIKIIDCDVEEPNDHIFLRPDIKTTDAISIPVPLIDEGKCTHCGKCSEVCVYNALAVLPKHVMVFAELCHGCGACSYLCPEKAISETPHNVGVIETGHAGKIEFVQGKLDIGQTMAPFVIRAARKLADSTKITIIDASPGTSCPVVEAIKESDFCLLVTEPTPFGLNDLILAVETVRELGIPCGVVLNRTGTGDDRTEKYCIDENLPILVTIPLERKIAEMYSRGIPLIEGMPEYRERFTAMFEKIGEILNERNNNS